MLYFVWVKANAKREAIIRAKEMERQKRMRSRKKIVTRGIKNKTLVNARAKTNPTHKRKVVRRKITKRRVRR